MAEKKNKKDEFEELDAWEEEDLEGFEEDFGDLEETVPEGEDVAEKPEEKAPKKTPKPAASKKAAKKDEGKPAELDTLNAAADVPVVISAVVGQTRTNIRNLLDYQPGYVIDLHRSPGETVDVVAGGKLIARGELVEMDGKLGVRILKLLR